MKIVEIITRVAVVLTVMATLVFSLGCDNPVSFLQILLSSPIQNSASGLILDDGEETEAAPTFPPAEDLVDLPRLSTLRLSGILHQMSPSLARPIPEKRTIVVRHNLLVAEN